jgi:hypothetical protein
VTSLSNTFAEVRSRLEALGLALPAIPTSARDQIGAAFRADLVSLGIDTALDGALFHAFAGLAIGLKVLIQQNADLALLNHYLSICEFLDPIIGTEQSDLSSLPDVDFLTSLNLAPVEPPVLRFACSKCGGSDAVVPVGSLYFCIPCASVIAQGGLAALRLAGQGMPQVGGPESNRESAHTESDAPQALESTDDANAAPLPLTAEASAGENVDNPLPALPFEPQSRITRWLIKRSERKAHG